MESAGRIRRKWRLLTVIAAGVLLAAGGVSLWRRAHRPPPPPEGVIVPRTRAAERAAVRAHDRDQLIRPGLKKPPTTAEAAHWSRMLNTMKWTAFRESEAIPPLRALFAAPGMPDEFRRLWFETVYTLFPDGFSDEMEVALATENDPRRFCMAAAWLQRRADSPETRARLRGVLTQRFPDWAAEPRFAALHAGLTESRSAALARRPPLAGLLAQPFDGRPVVFSLQRLDRQYPGRAIVRDASGHWVTGADGTLFSVSQLARAVNDLPGTLTNGNTPQGIFEMREFYVSRNKSIGPTRTVVLGLPGEYDRTWTLERYQALLPASWQDWWPAREAWWAGQAGRNEILAHGTTIDPEPWRDLPFYPNTPSHGCLTAPETWDPDTGRRLTSAQADLADAVERAGGPPGYLVVVELDAQPSPVTAAEAAALASQGKRQDL